MAAILGTRDRIKKVNNIKIPTLIIHGDIDPLVKPKNAFHSHKLIPNSKLLMIENMGADYIFNSSAEQGLSLKNLSRIRVDGACPDHPTGTGQ